MASEISWTYIEFEFLELTNNRNSILRVPIDRDRTQLQSTYTIAVTGIHATYKQRKKTNCSISKHKIKNLFDEVDAGAQRIGKRIHKLWYQIVTKIFILKSCKDKHLHEHFFKRSEQINKIADKRNFVNSVAIYKNYYKKTNNIDGKYVFCDKENKTMVRVLTRSSKFTRKLTVTRRKTIRDYMQCPR